jgi:hypothetical protein
LYIAESPNTYIQNRPARSEETIVGFTLKKRKKREDKRTFYFPLNDERDTRIAEIFEPLLASELVL